MNLSGLKAGAGLEEVMKALASAPQISDPRLAHLNMQKATFQQSNSPTSGLTYYDLETGAKFLYPVLTPLRNDIARVSGKGGIQAAWRAVTGVNTGNLDVGVSGGNRGAVMAVTTADYTASYKGIGIEDNVDFEAQYAGQGFDDIRAIAAKTGLEALMLGEELLLLGGNGNVPIGTTNTPVTAPATTGGALAAATYSVAVVALTLQGYQTASVAGGIRTLVTRTNADGSVDQYGGGSAQKSPLVAAVVGGSGAGMIAATVAAQRGALGYAWYWGIQGSGNIYLGAITTVPELDILADATGTQKWSDLPASDNSVNNLVFDGLITQAFKSGSNAYWTDLGGGFLTSDNAGGIVQIDEMLKDRWDNYRLSPDTIWLNSQEMLNIGKKVLGAGGAGTGAYRVVVDQKQGAMVGGIVVATYLNKFTLGGPNVIQIRLHPNMPPGCILATTNKLPYPMSNVGNIMQVRTRQDYYQIEWPLVTRKYEYGVYADEVLQHYFPPSMGLITGIGNG